MKFIHHSRLSCFVASGNGIEGWLGGGGGSNLIGWAGLGKSFVASGIGIKVWLGGGGGSNLIGWAVLDSDGHGGGDEAGNGEFHLFRFFLI